MIRRLAFVLGCGVVSVGLIVAVVGLRAATHAAVVWTSQLDSDHTIMRVELADGSCFYWFENTRANTVAVVACLPGR